MKPKTAQEILKKVVKDYEEISNEFDQTRQHSWSEFQSFLKYIKDGQKVLDLGCGNGRFYKFLEQNRKINYLGIDNNKKFIEIAKNHFPKAKFKIGDLLKLPIKNSSIETVTAIASLHHIPSRKLREKALKEMQRVLKKNGILILTVWNLFQAKYRKYIWHSRLRYIYSFGKYDSRDTFIPWGKSGVKRYYYAFKISELKKLLKENGFEIMEQYHNNNFVFICRKP